MKRYQRVNLFGGDPKILAGGANVLKQKIESIEKMRKAENRETALSFGLHDCLNGLWYYHFEMAPMPEVPVTASFFVDNGIDFAWEYFEGDWRNGYKMFPYEEPCTAEESRLKTQWNHQFFQGTLLCLLKNDRDSLERIAKWIDRDIIPIGASNPFGGHSHATLFYYSPLFFVFARYFCGVDQEEYAQEIDSIKNGKQAKTKTFLKILESICSQDAKGFEKQISKIVTNFIKTNEKVDQRISEDISYEATWMWNIALRSCMTMPELPEEIMDRIMTPQSIGLEK